MTTETNASDTPELTPDERALLDALRTGGYSRLIKLAGEREEARKAELSKASRAAIHDMLEANKSGDHLAYEVAFAELRSANVSTPDEAEKKDREDAIHDAWIKAESAYSIPQIERVALFVIGRLVLQGYFTRYALHELDGMVQDYAAYISEGILDLSETPAPFFEELKNYKSYRS